MTKFRIDRRIPSANGVLDAFVGGDSFSDRPVILKRLCAPWNAVPALALQLQSMAKPFPSIDGIVRITDVGVVDEVPWLVHDFVDGESLRQLFTRANAISVRLSVCEIVAIVRQIAHRLKTLHREGFSHGDVCPATVLITRQGEAKIVDAGVAATIVHVTNTGPPRAEPHFISPEQFEGASGHASDVFRLGLMLFEGLTGTSFFSGHDFQDALESCQQHTGYVRKPGQRISNSMTPLLEAMLKPRPADRPPMKRVAQWLDDAASQAKCHDGGVEVTELFQRLFAQRLAPNEISLTQVREIDLQIPSVTPQEARLASKTTGSFKQSVVFARIATKRMPSQEFPVFRPEAHARDQTSARSTNETSTQSDNIVPGLVEFLVDRGALIHSQQMHVKAECERSGKTPEEMLLALGLCDEDTIVSAVADLTHTPFVSGKKLDQLSMSTAALSLVPQKLAAQLELVPLSVKRATQLMVAVRDPTDPKVLSALTAATGLTGVVAVRAGPTAIRRTRERFYAAFEVLGLPATPNDLSATISDAVPTVPVLIPEAAWLEATADAVPRLSRPDKPTAETTVPDGAALEVGPIGDDAARIIEMLLSGKGPQGQEAHQLIALTQAVAMRIDLPQTEINRLQLSVTMIAVSNLSAGRRAHELPKAPEVKAMAGPAWPKIAAFLAPLFSRPVPLPNEPGAQILCLILAFAHHAGEPRPQHFKTDARLMSVLAQMKFPKAMTEALATELRMSST